MDAKIIYNNNTMMLGFGGGAAEIIHELRIGCEKNNNPWMMCRVA